ncbi:M56 family metallopeptidase [Pseudonocardia sediminis]|uniref:M56 family metallopeptidase n=1 Tax=Pseudonocardia sediminis TaxID=1397368 RepID=UPI0013EF4CC0|nr:M56 family metallopeptidase [Pseudonocardia sediminis]
MLVVGVVTTGVAMPAVLSTLSRTSLSPAAHLCMWWSAIASTGLSAVAALLVLLLPGHGGLAAAEWLLASCWAALRSGPLHLDGAAAFAVTALLAVAAVRATTRIGRSLATVRNRSRTLLTMLGPIGEWEQGVLWIDHSDALAFSLGGRAQAVVASTGLRRRLGASEIQAVLDHERSHLVGRHHVQVLIAEALARALPVLPLFRRAPQAIRHLVELAADERAARYNDRTVLRRALLGIASGGHSEVPPGALGAAGTSVEHRLRRLTHDQRQHSRERQIGECTLAIVTGTMLPLLAGSAAALLLFLVSCA